MKTVKVELEHCYGIKALKHKFDFGGNRRAYAVYAPNGTMKSSFARTFQDLARGTQPSDRLFKNRKTTFSVVDEAGAAIEKDRVLVVLPYDDEFGQSEKVCTLLVDAALRKRYEEIHAEIETAEKLLIEAVKARAKVKKADLRSEISLAFTKERSSLKLALERISTDILSSEPLPLANIEYERVFTDALVAAMKAGDLNKDISEYITRYNQLLDASVFFKRGTFEYYNADQISSNLKKNGFFDAGHTATLKSETEDVEIKTEADLKGQIEKEQAAIIADDKLRKKFSAVASKLDKNEALREFKKYLLENMFILPHLDNVEKFRDDVLIAYIKSEQALYDDLISKYKAAAAEKESIEKEAAKQTTKWEAAIDIFNQRFHVPFQLVAKNRIKVMLEGEGAIQLGFTYFDGPDSIEVDQDSLLESLSMGEKKALYILHVIFEVEARRNANQETLFVIDDIADSFDYQNKYAIIQYLKEISETPIFKQIILTHNFDFLRTIESRFVTYSYCLMASKEDDGVNLAKAVGGIRNIFSNDLRKHFFNDQTKQIAAIPFLRNLIEFSLGDKEADYLTLTSMVHWKPDTGGLTVGHLDAIYTKVCGLPGTSPDQAKPIADLIEEVAAVCLAGQANGLLVNKVVLAMAARLQAEKYMVAKIADNAFWGGIQSLQTQELLTKFREVHAGEHDAIKVLDRVALMTPENIHLNSFMYEPIIDMGEAHLRRLYADVKQLV